MKGCIPQANLEGPRVVKNIVYQFAGFNLWVQIFLKMREHQKKGALKQKTEASLYTLDWGFKKIPVALDTYVLVTKILQNRAKFRYTKAVFKNYKNLNNFRQAVESPKSCNLTGFFQKNIFLWLKHYKHWCVDSPNYLCHF